MTDNYRIIEALEKIAHELGALRAVVVPALTPVWQIEHGKPARMIWPPAHDDDSAPLAQRDIIREWLRKRSYAGLCDVDGNCTCSLNHLWGACYESTHGGPSPDCRPIRNIEAKKAPAARADTSQDAERG